MTLYAPKLRTEDEMTPPDDEDDAEERQNRLADYCDAKLHERYENAISIERQPR
jgi:hypothetical protein